jgi:hypothetical protein
MRCIEAWIAANEALMRVVRAEMTGLHLASLLLVAIITSAASLAPAGARVMELGC